MATFCVEIPDEEISRVITAMCANYKYQSQIVDPDYAPDIDPLTSTINDPVGLIDNPETPYQFVNRITREYLMNNTVAFEIKQAKQSIQLTDTPIITDPNM